MFAKSLIVSLALAAAAVRADLYISTPPELKQVSFLFWYSARRVALPGGGLSRRCRHLRSLLLSGAGR
jgi:hypothetical protein